MTSCHVSPYAIILRSITALTFLLDFRESIKLVIQIVIKHCYLDMTFLKNSRHVKGRVTKKKMGGGLQTEMRAGEITAEVIQNS